METNNRDSAVWDGDNKSNVQGNLDGAYIRYAVNGYGLGLGKYGNTYASKLSSNSSNLTDYNNNDFSGIYATSTAFNKGDGKDNYVAELRAYGRGEKTTIGSKKYDGKFELALFKVNDNGKRSPAGTHIPDRYRRNDLRRRAWRTSPAVMCRKWNAIMGTLPQQM